MVWVQRMSVTREEQPHEFHEGTAIKCGSLWSTCANLCPAHAVRADLNQPATKQRANGTWWTGW